MIDHREQWVADEQVLARIGRAVRGQNPHDSSVRLPRELADMAVAAWERDDEGEVGQESAVQALTRGRAAALALIGLAVRERGRHHSDEVHVVLDAEQVSAAVDAAEPTG